MATVFTRIINGELPGRFVYRDETCVAFLTIAPITYGHTLVVPIEEVDRWTDLDGTTMAHLGVVAQQVGEAVRTAFDAQRAGLLIAGFEVPHTHLHVFPANSMAGFSLNPDEMVADPDPERMDAAAEAIRAALREAGHGEFVPA
ncbi:HIT family protein [Propioniferax innocua]|uniref:Histidine triad (HIT) family protein n=1 Tax=Propioniferax innocua TaxID=1753 RepID=A0A542ZQD5_9ACTN|nr:HIT family protein [Propioniferax innocua]TQL62573.1 histidine triad (HIT) family protein [Propioniferax innocua]